MPGLESDLVFLSYAHEDLDKVRKVYEGLKERKVNVWFDKKDLGIGRWKPQIVKTISRSKYFVICLSNAALKKTSGKKPGFQDEELQTAWEFAGEQDERGFTIIPVRLEDCGHGDMRLSGWQQYDLFEDWGGVLDTLAVNLGGVSLSDATAIDKRTEEEKMIAGMFGKGITFYFSGEYEKALTFFEGVMNLKPDSLITQLVWNIKGAALDDLGRHDEAIEAYNKAIEIKPESHEAWSNKGNALDDLGRHDEAIEAYNKAIEIKPDSQKAWYNLACLYSLKKEKDKALKYLQKAIENGYNNLSHIKKDTDLDFIRNEKEFQEIISKLTS